MHGMCAITSVCFCFDSGLGVHFPDVVWVEQGKMLPAERDGKTTKSISFRLPHCLAVNLLVSLPAQQQSALLPTHPITSAATIHSYEDSPRLDVCV